MEVYDDNGIVLSDHRSVLNRWACDYKELYKGYDTNYFDADFYKYAQAQIIRLKAACNNMDEGNMNQSISSNEVDKVLRKLRNNKSVGIDNLQELFN